MALNNITFVKGKGGLGRALPGTDYYSGMVFYDDTLPSGFSTTERIKQVFSIEDAEALGITGTYNDETKATATLTISNSGQTGDFLSVSVKEGGNNGSKSISGGTLVDSVYRTVNILTYTKPNNLATGTIPVAVDVAQAINLNFDTHGYSASTNGSIITISAKAGLGTFPNGKSFVLSSLGNLGVIGTSFSGGVASKLAVKHYHIAEYFRIQPQGNLYVGIFAVPSGTYDFAEIGLMSSFSNGTIKQLGIHQTSQAYSASNLTTIQAACETLDALIAPLSVIFAPNIASVSNLSTLTDLSTFSSNKVSVNVSQDAGGLGNQLAWGNSFSITNLGATLGAVALASVHEDIAWISKFNISNGIEDEVIGFGNGVSINDASISTNLLSLIDVNRYIFLRKLINVSGSFFNDSHTAIAQSSDYAYIENNRTIDKAIRGVYADLIPNLNGPLVLNSDGTLDDGVVAYLQSQGSISVNQMVRNGEISAVSVTIDPAQDVASTSTIVVAIKIVPVGVGRNIIVNIGFTTSI